MDKEGKVIVDISKWRKKPPAAEIMPAEKTEILRCIINASIYIDDREAKKIMYAVIAGLGTARTCRVVRAQYLEDNPPCTMDVTDGIWAVMQTLGKELEND